MALSLQLEAPGGHWILLRLEGLLLHSGAGRAYWKLLVGGTGQGCPIPGRNEPAPDRHMEKQEGSEASSSSPWSCFRGEWSHAWYKPHLLQSRLSCQELWELDSGVTTGVCEGMGLVYGISRVKMGLRHQPREAGENSSNPEG